MSAPLPVRRRWPLRALPLLALLAACTQAPPPTVSLEGRACVAQPDLGAAQALSLGGRTVRVTLDDAAPCWQPAGQPGAVYAAFVLPPAAESYLVWVTSEPIGQGLFSPRLLVLDEGGTFRRELPRDTFQFHGATLRAGLRTRDGERYLIVASDPASVGQGVSQLASTIHTSTVTSSKGGSSSYAFGSEGTRTMTFALNGRVAVSAEPLPQAR